MKRKNITEEQQSFGALLRMPFETLAIRVYTTLAEQGFADLRPAYGAVFRYIGVDGSRITELAERAQMTKQSMGYLVDYLHQHGYVQIGPDPSDGRAKCITLTERGVAAQRAALEISGQVEQEWAQRLGQEEMRQLRHLLERLTTHLEP